jgi:hypothetical protein
VERVAELCAVRYNLARGQLAVLFVHEHLVALGAKLFRVKAGNGRTGPGEADKLGTVEARGVVQDARAVNNGDRLVLAEENLVCTLVKFWTVSISRIHDPYSISYIPNSISHIP